MFKRLLGISCRKCQLKIKANQIVAAVYEFVSRGSRVEVNYRTD